MKMEITMCIPNQNVERLIVIPITEHAIDSQKIQIFIETHIFPTKIIF